jgi:hypothetical protein
LTGYWGMLRGIKPTELLSGSLGGRLGVVKLKYGKPYWGQVVNIFGEGHTLCILKTSCKFRERFFVSTLNTFPVAVKSHW